jgi:cytidylate kinase
VYAQSSASDREVGRLLERQMRNWELAHAQPTGGRVAAGDQAVESFVSLSRMAGLPGEEVAAAIHEKTGWPVFDKEVLTEMAGSDDLRRRVFEALDERDVRWIDEFFRSLTQSRFISREAYFHRLSKTVVALARKGPVIFLGRATDLILPRDVGLRVRLTAAPSYCVERYAEAHQLSHEAAAREVSQIEQERDRFVRHHFNHGGNESTRHDLIINCARFETGQVVDIVMTALRAKNLLENSARAGAAKP